MTVVSRARTFVQIDTFHAGDEADIQALNRLEYGPTDFMAKPENFEWRYRGNPAEPTILCLARDTSTLRVVGYIWIIPVQMRLYGRDEKAAIQADLLIHPEYRNGLVYAMLIRRKQQILREKNIPFRYSFPTSEYLKRSRHVEEGASFLVPLVVMPMNLKKLSHHYQKNTWLKPVFDWGGRMIQPIWFHSRAVKRSQHKLEIEHLERFDKRFDNFWFRVQDKYPIMAVRNQAFLSWRFAPISSRKYHILAATAAGELVGYSIIRCTDEIRNIPVGLIADMLLEPGSRGEYAGQLIMAEAGRFFRAEKVWLAGGLMLPHTSEYAALCRAGYRSCPKRLAPRLFHLRFKSEDASLLKTSEIREKDWFVTIADYESY